MSASPLVMKRFTPLSNQQPSFSLYVAFSITDCRSEPASGSVKSIDMVSPWHTRGMKRLCWSVFPNSYNVSMQSCSDHILPKPASAAATISAHIVYGVIGKLRSEEHTSELQSRQYLVCRL